MKNQRNHHVFARLFSSDLFSVTLFTVIFIVFMAIARPNFLSSNNLSVVVKIFCVTAVVGFSQMVIIATGSMNLAVGGIGGVAAIIAGITMSRFGASSGVAIVVGIVTGIVVGAINGLLINHFGGGGPEAFLTTLAMNSVLKGITYGLTSGEPIYDINKWFQDFGQGQFLGLPLIFYVMLVLAILVFLMFKYLGIGRQILSFGANPKAAELYGVSRYKTVLLSQIISGALAACAGLMLMARLGSAQTDIGDDWMMFSFAAPILGGTRQAGGRVNVVGAVLGALLLGAIKNALVFLNLDVYYVTLIQGCIILIAAATDRVKMGIEEKTAGKAGA